MNKKLKVMTVVGTRPEIIRLSRIMAALEKTVDHVLVHTGQNYDYELNEVFFSDLEISKPDHFLGAAGNSLGETLGGILAGTEKVLTEEKPDAFLVLGDTNSAVSAIMARRMKVPIYHMEAGNRSFDKNVPEETNRRIVDHIADFNLAYTEHARRHLLAEGMEHRRVYVTGTPMREVLQHYLEQIQSSDILERLGLKKQEYFIVSLHREENVDSPSRLAELVSALNQLADKYNKPVIVSKHPRTRARLESDQADLNPLVKWMKPFGFHDYNHLQSMCLCAVSDSGTIVEESTILGFPAITPRESIERPEGLDCGSVIMTGVNASTMLLAIDAIVGQFTKQSTAQWAQRIPDDYKIENTSDRVVNLILGTAKLTHAWDGIRKFED